jgi:ABC-2 type transport system permease protein
MTSPALLIARREFMTYVATSSFWIAILISPLALGVALLAAQHHAPAAKPAATPLAVACPDAALAASAGAAVVEAAGLEGQDVTLQPGPAARTARIACKVDAHGAVSWRLSGPLHLSASGQVLVMRTIERDAAAGGALSAADSNEPAFVQDDERPEEIPHLGRLALLMMLWLVLTGSLGMLLQAVVRERSTRALEMLLAASRAREIVIGKLLGVGAISAIVLVLWLMSAALLSNSLPPTLSIARMIGPDLADPIGLVRAAVIFVLAYALYGFAIIALGASARDSASAQNLARPLFVVLVAVFFVGMGDAMNGTPPQPWQLFTPPFTPFALLLSGPAGLPWPQQLAGFVLLCASTALCARWAVRSLTLVPGNPLNALLPRRRRARRA